MNKRTHSVPFKVVRYCSIKVMRGQSTFNLEQYSVPHDLGHQVLSANNRFLDALNTRRWSPYFFTVSCKNGTALSPYLMIDRRMMPGDNNLAENTAEFLYCSTATNSTLKINSRPGMCCNTPNPLKIDSINKCSLDNKYVILVSINDCNISAYE